ncbi:uncharacterized protein LOC128966261 [Oppia nitens]|uniref:uncharacterized protein LOC128966261 n=1 Tax=Oppia nitens TaxID=1686743 RepID=UPI0023DB8DBC|nr:uncharacterized protein LOC128966261 [Oppia nitens]
MYDSIELIVVFRGFLICRQWFCLDHLNDRQNVLSFDKQIKVKLISDLVQTIIFSRKLVFCSNYRTLVFKHIRQQVLNICPKFASSVTGICAVNEITKTNVLLKIKLRSIDHQLVIDKSWNRRLTALVSLRYEVDDNFSWLSTLGGAYSSLGEYDVNCAIKAGQISVSQLRLAGLTGDPNLVAKCGIFMVYSLCQQHRRWEAIKLIRRTLYPFITRIQFCDQTLKAMYSALCYHTVIGLNNNGNMYFI